MNLDLSFSESGGKFNTNFGETSVIHDGQNGATMKTVEGTLPLTVDGVGQRLEDYKIYGAEG